MLKPGVFDHPTKNIELIETHISWVILTGDFAYKIKKPVDFGFLDFSTLEKRHQCCKQELQLNSRLAPDIYLDVITITGTSEEPRISGSGKVFEYAVKMTQFPQSTWIHRPIQANLQSSLSGAGQRLKNWALNLLNASMMVLFASVMVTCICAI